MCNRTIKSTLGANIGANLSVLCQVNAFPAPTSFSWSFNNTKQSYLVAGEKFSQAGLASELIHSVNSDLDYGHFYCSASNSEGRMIFVGQNLFKIADYFEVEFRPI